MKKPRTGKTSEGLLLVFDMTLLFVRRLGLRQGLHGRDHRGRHPLRGQVAQTGDVLQPRRVERTLLVSDAGYTVKGVQWVRTHVSRAANMTAAVTKVITPSEARS